MESSQQAVDTIEECYETMTVHKVWILTEDMDDAESLRVMMADRDYSVAGDALPTSAFLSGFDNTLITDWETYANDQDAFRCVLPVVDIVLFEGISELNYAAWKRWAQLSEGAGFYMKPTVQVYEMY